jgi:annexin A7/11
VASLPQGQGTVRASPSFNAEEDSKVLRKAMKGLGTDEKAILGVLSARSNGQRQEIKNRFKSMYGKDLIQEVKSEVSGHFEELCVALLKTPTEFDAEELRESMSGAGTDEKALIEILCTRTNKEIQDIKAMYKLKFSRDLEKDIMSETSGHFKRLLVSMSMGNRIENPNVDISKAKQDAQELLQAGEKKIGTDESKFNQILCSQSYEQLRQVFQEYKNLSKKGLDQVIKNEMSGDLESGLLAVFYAVENKHRFFADRLHNCMAGAGTKDKTLIRIVVSRCEIDMVQIKAEFQRQHGKSLESFISGDTSGDYQKFLLALTKGF